MTASDKKKTQIFLALLAIAGVTYFFLYRSEGTTATADKGKTKAIVQRDIKNPTIDLQLIEGMGADEVGQKNIFQYRQKPLAAAPPPPIRPNPVPTNLPPSAPYVPPPPPPPPFKAFKYEGFSVRKPGELLASLSEGGNVYTVKLGECLMGQYCVRQLSETSIEIEDTQIKQRRSFQRSLQ